MNAFLIFIVAFTLRLIHIWQIRRSPFFTVLMGDARGYDEWAQRIAGGNWIGHDVFYQAPLYPYFLGSIYWVAGRSLMLVRVVQAVIGSCSCVLVGASARAQQPRHRAGIAGQARRSHRGVPARPCHPARLRGRAAEPDDGARRPPCATKVE